MDEPILKTKYPAKEHARKVAAYLKQQGLEQNGVIYLEGGKASMHEDCDQEAVFRSVAIVFDIYSLLLRTLC